MSRVIQDTEFESVMVRLRKWSNGAKVELRRTQKSRMFHAVMSIVITLTAAGLAASQDLRLTVEVGNNEFYSFQKQVDRIEPIVVKPATVARAWFRENRLYVEGLAPGVATITLKGMYRRLVVGTQIRENPQPFNYQIHVTVLAARTDVQPTIKNYRVSQRTSRTTQLDHFLGSPFGETSRAVEWNVDPPRSSNGNIAAAQWVRNSRGNLAVQITGVSGGRATIVLSGRRRVNNSWQRVTRSIEVVVAGRNSDGEADQPEPGSAGSTEESGASLPPANSVEALESLYQNNQSAAASIQSDEDRERVIREFNKIESLIKITIANEQKAAAPRPEVLSRLNDLLERVGRAREQLSSNTSPEAPAPSVASEHENSFAGTWTLFHRGVKQRDYRIQDDGTQIHIYSGAKLWILILGRGPIMDCRLPAGSSDDLGFGARLVQLRRGSNPNEYEFWVTPSMYEATYVATGYTLVRQ